MRHFVQGVRETDGRAVEFHAPVEYDDGNPIEIFLEEVEDPTEFSDLSVKSGVGLPSSDTQG